MKLFQASQTMGQVLLVAGSIGAAAVGVLPFASRSCAGPAWELPANGLMRVAGPTAPKAESGRVVRVVDGGW